MAFQDSGAYPSLGIAIVSCATIRSDLFVCFWFTSHRSGYERRRTDFRGGRQAGVRTQKPVKSELVLFGESVTQLTK